MGRSLSSSGSKGSAHGASGFSTSSSSLAGLTPTVAAATLVLRGPQSQELVAARMAVTAGFPAQVRCEIPGAHPEGGQQLALCAAGSTTSVTYVTPAASRGSETRGELLIDSFEPIPFAVAHDPKRGVSYVALAGRRRYTALHAEPWNWRDSAAEKPTEGLAADLEISGALLSVRLRTATPQEHKRCLQLQALREAESGEDYDTLHAQVTKAKAAGVEMELIERGEERLRVLQKRGRHVHEGCDKESLRNEMQWAKITQRHGAPDQCQLCALSEDCPCNSHDSLAEELSITRGAVQSILGEERGDEMLFQELLDGALAVKEGSVWKAGGKFIFSAFSRNQSVTALTRMLESAGRKRCAELLLRLVRHSEELRGGFVTAVQVNFHPHGGTFHDNHRDIYSGKQRAGPNCTCSFRECVGTVCYSLGSSRICLTETTTDEQSAIASCGEGCEGKRERKWLHSGDAMYFNAAWNQNHMHGIPIMEEATGPRISIAFLLGAPDVSPAI